MSIFRKFSRSYAEQIEKENKILAKSRWMVEEYNKYQERTYLDNTEETLALKVTLVSGDSRIVTRFTYGDEDLDKCFLYLDGPERTIKVVSYETRRMRSAYRFPGRMLADLILLVSYETRRMRSASIRPGNLYAEIHPCNREYLCPVAEMHLNRDNIESIEYVKVRVSSKGSIEAEDYDRFVERMTPIYEQSMEEKK